MKCIFKHIRHILIFEVLKFDKSNEFIWLFENIPDILITFEVWKSDKFNEFYHNEKTYNP